MTRFYILHASDYPEVPPHIVGEIVSFPAEPVSHNLGLKGARALSRQDLLATPEGHRALEAWEAGDDSAWEEDQRLFDAEAAAQEILDHAAYEALGPGAFERWMGGPSDPP